MGAPTNVRGNVCATPASSSRPPLPTQPNEADRKSARRATPPPSDAAPPLWHLGHLVRSACRSPSPPCWSQTSRSYGRWSSRSWTAPWEDERALGNGGSLGGQSAVRASFLLPGKAVDYPGESAPYLPTRESDVRTRSPSRPQPEAAL